MSGKLGDRQADQYFIDISFQAVEKAFNYFKRNQPENSNFTAPEESDSIHEKLLFILVCLDTMWNTKIVGKIDAWIGLDEIAHKASSPLPSIKITGNN